MGIDLNQFVDHNLPPCLKHEPSYQTENNFSILKNEKSTFVDLNLDKFGKMGTIERKNNVYRRSHWQK